MILLYLNPDIITASAVTESHSHSVVNQLSRAVPRDPSQRASPVLSSPSPDLLVLKAAFQQLPSPSPYRKDQNVLNPSHKREFLLVVQHVGYGSRRRVAHGYPPVHPHAPGRPVHGPQADRPKHAWLGRRGQAHLPKVEIVAVGLERVRPREQKRRRTGQIVAGDEDWLQRVLQGQDPTRSPVLERPSHHLFQTGLAAAGFLQDTLEEPSALPRGSAEFLAISREEAPRVVRVENRAAPVARCEEHRREHPADSATGGDVEVVGDSGVRDAPHPTAVHAEYAYFSPLILQLLNAAVGGGGGGDLLGDPKLAVIVAEEELALQDGENLVAQFVCVDARLLAQFHHWILLFPIDINYARHFLG
ncbi:acetyl-coenzyme A carboxylase carboxyltransferase subunit alpha [Striga asiatica]|uniref:Acetyl-coenzyme A carboxylase carboxyltransferase subunit alpha n=1 Tax=Striga asiatica TaxID=4170 RepID=A0A5A7R1R9_STRAF|nr:acetyl-coenzyme A carboxylase carboxyltransferase subunit alpha [Striga asiatica]